MVQHLETVADFKTAVQQNTIILIDAYADWCGPCKTMAPIFESLATQANSKGVACYKLNTDVAQALAAELCVTSLPSFILVENGLVRDVVIGANRAGLEKLVATAIGMMAVHFSL